MVRYENNYSVSELKETGEQFVYDIEVDSVHNFFANGILCHNSMYTISNVPELAERKYGKNISIDDMTTLIEKFYSDKVDPIIKKGYEELADYMNARNKMNMKLETISDSGFWLASKKYAIRVIKAEGVKLHKPKPKIKGIEIVSSSTPKIIKPALKKIIETMLDGIDVDKIRLICQEFKKEFMQMAYYDIGVPTSMNKTAKYIDLPKGTSIHIKGGILYNRYIEENNLIEFKKIIDGDRIKYIYLKTPNKFHNSHVISFLDKIPEELLGFIDYEEQFNSVFLSTVEDKLKRFGYTVRVSKRNLKSLFKKKEEE